MFQNLQKAEKITLWHAFFSRKLYVGLQGSNVEKMSKVTTLGQFIIEKQSDFPYAKGELSRLLRDIGIASKIVNREVNKAGLADILGEAGEINIQGETVKKLDVFANEQFIAALSAGGECCAIASEENEDIIPIDNKQ